MKVFLSSTYVDLMEHRRQAAEVLERLGQQAGRMEVFGARAFWRHKDALNRNVIAPGQYHPR
jgi:hypothetical protein